MDKAHLLLWLMSILLLWTVAYLIVIALRNRLPFLEANVTDTSVRPSPRNPKRMQFLVRYHFSPTHNRNPGFFWLNLRGDRPEAAVASPQYEQLASLFPKGKVMNFHFVPHCKYLFDLIPPSPFVAQTAMLMGIIAASLTAGLAVVILVIAGLG
jgi:hypothetical protein